MTPATPTVSRLPAPPSPAQRHAMTEDRVLFVLLATLFAGVVLFLAIRYWAL